MPNSMREYDGNDIFDIEEIVTFHPRHTRVFVVYNRSNIKRVSIYYLINSANLANYSSVFVKDI